MTLLSRKSLEGNARWLLIISGIFTLSVALSNTFVNVYLWKVDESYISIGWYNFALYCMIPVTFLIAGAIAKRVHTVLTMRIGIVLHGAFYLLTLVAGDIVARWPVLLGLLMGLAAGFYWCSFNELSLQCTVSETRDRFYGLNGVVGAIAGMIAPPLSGYVIAQEDKFGGLSGYHVIFAISLGMFVAAVLCTMKLRGTHTEGTLSLSVIWRGLQYRPWRLTLFACAVYGLREGVFLFLIGLLMYLATGSEMRLGQFFLLQSALSFGAFYVVSRIVKPNRRLLVLRVGAFAMAACAVWFLMPLRAWVLLLYGASIAIVLPSFLVPLQGFVFDRISLVSGDNPHHMEHIIGRELFENAGRVVGIGAFILWMVFQPSGQGLGWFAFTLGFVQVVSWWFLRLSCKNAANSRTSTYVSNGG